MDPMGIQGPLSEKSYRETLEMIERDERDYHNLVALPTALKSLARAQAALLVGRGIISPKDVVPIKPTSFAHLSAPLEPLRPRPRPRLQPRRRRTPAPSLDRIHLDQGAPAVTPARAPNQIEPTGGPQAHRPTVDESEHEGHEGSVPARASDSSPRADETAETQTQA